MQDIGDDEVEVFAKQRRRRWQLALGLVVALPALGWLIHLLLRPPPCEAFVIEICEGVGGECLKMNDTLTQLGVPDDECREALDALEAALEDAPREVEGFVKVEILFELLAPYVDVEELDRQAKRQMR